MLTPDMKTVVCIAVYSTRTTATCRARATKCACSWTYSRLHSVGIEDYWTPIPVNTTFLKHVDMLVGPSHFKLVASYLDCAAVPYEIVIQDIQDAIDHENPPVRQGPGGSYEDQLLGRPGALI